jgi:ubiquinone/menaquinone biosynthesis C-methylase UbiE
MIPGARSHLTGNVGAQVKFRVPPGRAMRLRRLVRWWRSLKKKYRAMRRLAPAPGATFADRRRFVVEAWAYWRHGTGFSSVVARRYCVGRGLEIGGSAHNPFRLDSLNVDFTDSVSTDFKQAELARCGKALPVDIVAPGDELPVPDASQDFVVSSHVLEHFTDPVGALLEWNRVVRPGGTVFMIVPHKDRTFDKDRPRTALEHLIRDHEIGGSEHHGDPTGHQHVWITADIIELIGWMKDRFALPWEVLEVQDRDDKVGNGFTVVIRKCAAEPAQGLGVKP